MKSNPERQRQQPREKVEVVPRERHFDRQERSCTKSVEDELQRKAKHLSAHEKRLRNFRRCSLTPR